jgi:hypothetical protein
VSKSNPIYPAGPERAIVKKLPTSDERAKELEKPHSDEERARGVESPMTRGASHGKKSHPIGKSEPTMYEKSIGRRASQGQRETHGNEASPIRMRNPNH